MTEPVRWPGRVVFAGILAMLVGTVVAAIFATAGDQVSSVAALVGGGVGLYGTLWLTCHWASREHGTGDMRADFGLGIERRDVWRGLGWGALARLAASIASLLAYAIGEELAGDNSAGLEEHADSLGFLFAAAVLACLVAPYFEELFFRGLLLRAFEGLLPLPLALLAQALLFGLAHFGGVEGIGNVGVIMATAAVGLVLGVVVHRTKRLGVAMCAHAWFNLVAVVALFATRPSG